MLVELLPDPEVEDLDGTPASVGGALLTGKEWSVALVGATAAVACVGWGQAEMKRGELWSVYMRCLFRLSG